MLYAAQAIVKKVQGPMKGHDTSQMGIYDTGLEDWTVKQVNMEEQGHPEGRDTGMKQKQTENTTRWEHSRKGENRQQGEEGLETTAPAADGANKVQEEKAQTTEPHRKQR